MLGLQNHVSIVYYNACSLFPKIDNLRLICASLCPNCVCVVETWLSDEIHDSEISIQGYSHVRLDRSRHGGGLIIFVNKLFSFSVVFKGSPDLEFLLLSCKTFINNPVFHLALFLQTT